MVLLGGWLAGGETVWRSWVLAGMQWKGLGVRKIRVAIESCEYGALLLGANEVHLVLLSTESLALASSCLIYMDPIHACLVVKPGQYC
jgi:hypothetical protein